MKTEIVVWDWKENPADEFKAALKSFGIHMQELPSLDGSDMNGYVLSDAKMTKKQIKQLEIDENLASEED